MKLKLGNVGEDKVAEYILIEFDYKIIERNYRCGRIGEIDIIAKDKNKYVFIEVKARKDAKYMDIHEQINYRKQKAIINAAKYYISQNSLDAEYRIDVATYNHEQDKVEYYKNAITPTFY